MLIQASDIIANALKNEGVDILVSKLFKDKALQKKLSSEYLAWRIEENKND